MGISDTTQQWYNTWQEACDAYVNTYEQGIVHATPIVNGPFDPCVGEDAELVLAFAHITV